MQHASCNYAVEVRLLDRVRNFCADDGIDIVNGFRLVLGIQDDQDMRVRKAALLKLDNMHPSADPAENMFAEQILA